MDEKENYEQCSGSCASCAGCGGDFEEPVPRHAKKTYAIFGGKGGTGKSTIAALLACELKRRGLRVGLLDADITGPSIPHMFGLKGKLIEFGDNMAPFTTENGIKVISYNLIPEILDNQVIMAGLDMANVAKFFWTDADWGELDFMILDMPSGAGDMPLNLFYTLPIDGVIIVASPGELNALMTRKAMKFVTLLSIPIMGIVENLTGLAPFDPEKLGELYGKADLALLASIPARPELAELINSGNIGKARVPELDGLADTLEETVKNA